MMNFRDLTQVRSANRKADERAREDRQTQSDPRQTEDGLLRLAAKGCAAAQSERHNLTLNEQQPNADQLSSPAMKDAR
jgi:hypothetical protein